jgi:hypothetical protein
VKIVCNAGPTRHATLKLYTTAFDASVDRQEAFHRGALRYRASQRYQSGKGHWRRTVKGVSAAQEEYEQIERTLQQNDVLSGCVDDKIR